MSLAFHDFAVAPQDQIDDPTRNGHIQPNRHGPAYPSSVTVKEFTGHWGIDIAQISGGFQAVIGVPKCAERQGQIQSSQNDVADQKGKVGATPLIGADIFFLVAHAQAREIQHQKERGEAACQEHGPHVCLTVMVANKEHAEAQRDAAQDDGDNRPLINRFRHIARTIDVRDRGECPAAPKTQFKQETCQSVIIGWMPNTERQTQLALINNLVRARRVAISIIIPFVCLLTISSIYLTNDNLSHHAYNLQIYTFHTIALLSTWVAIRHYQASEVPYMAMLTVGGSFVVTKFIILASYATFDGFSLGITDSLIWLYALLIFALINIKSGFYWFYSVSLMSILTSLGMIYVYFNTMLPGFNSTFVSLLQLLSIGWIILVGSKTYMVGKELHTTHITKLATLEAIAHTDTLTNLPNRRYLEHYLQVFIDHSDSRTLSLMFIDLDSFKLVNDTLGHSKGDDLLRRMALLLAQLSGNTSVVGRLNGDEFIILLPEVTGEDAEQLGQKILNHLQKDGLELGIEYQHFRLTLSIGISVYPQDGRTPEELLRHADSAMFSVKRNGKQNVRRYNLQDDAETEYKQELARELAGALDREEISLVFQPLYNLKTGKLIKAEVLMRWNHPVLGWVSPATFIPVAEQAGLITSLGYWALKQSCRHASQWPSITFCVNVSVLQLLQTDFSQQVSNLLHEYQLCASQIELELTETTMMEDNPNTMEALRSIRAAGIALTIDDFGIGYSNLARLRTLPVETVKIDQSFIRSLAGSELDRRYATQMIHSVVQISNIAHLHVTAEGIETFEQLKTIRTLGCHTGQGYFLSRPCSAEQLGALLQKTDLPHWAAD